MINYYLFNCLFLTIVNGIVINTGYGPIEGFDIEKGKYYSFKRVPFAKPPIGKLRFQKPQPPSKWTEILNAKEYGPACMTNSTTSTSPQKWVDEDCLHLNIFTTDYCLKSKDCPVVFYLHGGGLNYDSAVMFQDEPLIRTFSSRDVILVITAFRLGIFSHFVISNQSIAPNNLAVYDILESLEFVNKEISNFGGNNKRVTLFGHSFGGVLSSALTFSETIDPDHRLFQQGIAMSPGNDFVSFNVLSNMTEMFAKRAKCYPDNLESDEKGIYMMRCLQNIEGVELLRIQRKMEEDGFEISGMIQREPLFNGKTLPEFWKTGKKIPFMLGTTIHEMDYSDSSAVWPAIALQFDNLPEVMLKYKNDKLLKNTEINHTDYTQQIMVSTKAKSIALANIGAPVYLYEYSYPKHSKHTDDLYYIMGVHSFEKDENEEELSNLYPELFMNFAKYGKPADNFERTNITTGSYYDIYLDFKTGRRPQMKDNYEKEVMDYWFIKMKEYDRNITEQKIKLCGKTNATCAMPNFRSIEFYEPSVKSSFYSFLLIASILFVSGILIGRCLVRKRNYYIQLDGRNYEKFID